MTLAFKAENRLMGIPEALRVRLSSNARAGIREYQQEYISSFREVIDAHDITAATGGNVAAVDARDAALAVKISSLYNDVTFLDCDAGESPLFAWMAEEGWRNIVGSEIMTLSVTGDVPPKLEEAVKNGRVNIGFMSPGDDDISRMLGDAAYLISDGRLIFRPRRIIIYLDEIENDGRKRWQTLEAEPGTPGAIWSVSTEKTSNRNTGLYSASFEKDISQLKKMDTLAEITVPYVDGISLGDYARIIRDEEDILIEFRKEMRSLSNIAVNESMNLSEYKRDVIDPKISKIARKFRHISNMHLLKTAGATFATGALSLIAMQSKGILGGLEVIAGGVGAVSVIKDAVDRANQIENLRDEPLYLLWKMSQAIK